MKRHIPATMASQHPDHANKPYWHDKEFIKVQYEYKECFLSYSDLGIEEYKWDWEGKLVDESVMERLLGEYYEYFKTNQLGKDKFLTFRLPNPKVENEFRLGRAFIGILSAAALATKVKLHSPPLFEVILPMTESAEEMIAIQEAFMEISSLKHGLYRLQNNSLKTLEVIPLFEQVSTIANSDAIIKKYLRLYKKKFHKTPSYLRPYVARSDPALNSGIVPTVLAIKVALSRYQRFSEEEGIELYPIIGSASLPFRGGLTPRTVNQFIEEYKGIRTALIQSGFRYDYAKKDIIEAINILNTTLKKKKAEKITPVVEKEIMQVASLVEPFYQTTIEDIAPMVNTIASSLPKRRERVQHVGLFGYSRGVGKVTLPRAIGFTAALYSIGIPPELIGTGRGIKRTVLLDKNKLVEKYYTNFKHDMIRAGKYLNRDVLSKLAKKSPAWQDVKEDIMYLERYLGVELGPSSLDEKEHAVLTSRIYENLASSVSPELLTKAGVLRKSLG